MIKDGPVSLAVERSNCKKEVNKNANRKILDSGWVLLPVKFWRLVLS